MKCKVLTYLGKPVVEGLLDKGVYESVAPKLYPINQTIDNLIQSVEMFCNATGQTGGQYIENLRKCELLECELSITSNQ